MTNSDILYIAKKQSATDINCSPDDFNKSEHVTVDAVIGEHARRYYREPIACNLVSYGSNIVASVKPEYRRIVDEYIHKFEFYHCFEAPNMHVLNGAFAPYGQKICFMAEYFLPDIDKLTLLPCPYKTRLLFQNDFESLYLPEWSNALCEDRKELDVLGVGAYESGRLIALAACSADCDDMWQIGVDVLPEYRGGGIASSLVSRLAKEILDNGKVPFYCSAWSNIGSVRTAVRCGFYPAWVELTVKPAEFVDKINA